ncbi:MAG: LamG-like jellyroll fold domain-containing protein [bacterium]|nr:LamG-like jellyroll fold domain-containing protein [bacterium]
MNGHTHIINKRSATSLTNKFLFWSVLAVVFVVSAITPLHLIYAQVPDHSYSFDEGSGGITADLSGSETGTLTNGALWSAGKNGTAVFFDGIDDKVALPSTLDISSLPFTIEAWINPSDYSNYHVIFSKRSSWNSGDMRVDVGMDSGDGRIYVASQPDFRAFSYSPPLNMWTHIAVVADVTGVSLYTNGMFQETIGPTTLGTNSSSLVNIGGTGDDQDYFSGLIDDVRIYTLALSQAEIQADMNTPVGANPPPAEIWQVSVPDGGSYADPITSVPWELDGSSPGYLFTAITADAGNVYTARGQNGSWNSPSCSLQRWNSITKELNVATGPFPCTGIYKLELKINPADNIMRLFAYREGAIEIRDKNGLTIIATEITDTSTIVPPCSNPCDHTTTGVANGSIAKRTVGRSDSLDIYVEHSDTPGSPGNFGSANPLNLYIGADVTTLPTWISDVVPAPTTNGSWLYFGAEEIALSPAGDYLYIAGGNKVGGVLSSQIEKRELPALPDPQVSSIISAPFQIDNGDNVDIYWSSSYADYCDITTSPSVWSGMGLPANGYELNIGPINPPVTFTALCTRNSDGKTGSASVTVTLAPNLPPQAVITNPASDIAINSGDTVVFDAGSCPSGSCDSDGSISAYEWREGDCITGTLLSSASTFNKSYFTVGSYSTYLTVKDDEGAWSNCALITITMPPKCNNGDFDDDGDGLPDEQDPGCWTNPTDSATYNQYDDDENNCGNQTPPMCEKNFGENFKTCRLDCAIKFYEN